jgi:hypothetical protein
MSSERPSGFASNSSNSNRITKDDFDNIRGFSNSQVQGHGLTPKDDLRRVQVDPEEDRSIWNNKNAKDRMDEYNRNNCYCDIAAGTDGCTMYSPIYGVEDDRPNKQRAFIRSLDEELLNAESLGSYIRNNILEE